MPDHIECELGRASSTRSMFLSMSCMSPLKHAELYYELSLDALLVLNTGIAIYKRSYELNQ